MAISNELSSDVAVAILASKKSPLKDIILEVHSALQKMSEETRAYHFRKKPLADDGPLVSTEKFYFAGELKQS